MGNFTANELEVINFTNTDTADFDGQWGGAAETFKPGETKPLPRFKAEHFANQLAQKILLREEKDFGDKGLTQSLIDKMLGALSSSPLPISPTELPKEPEFAGAPKEEVSLPPTSTATGFTCDRCGKTFKVRVALAGHQR